MRRILVYLVVMAFLLAASANSAFAETNPENQGDALTAPGQADAIENCQENVTKQVADPNPTNGHQLPGTTFPTNCDHFWQGSGF